MTPLVIRAARAVGIAVLLALVFVAAFVIPAHDPEPNGLPLVQAGAPAALVETLKSQGFDVGAVDGRRAAQRAIRDRDAYGAIVPGPGGRPELLVASGASASVATLLTGIGQRARIPVAADLAPPPAGDPRGLTLNLLVLPLTITAIIGALLAVQLLPEVGARIRIALTSLVGLLSGLGTLAIVHALDALPGSFLAQAGLAALMVIAVGLAAGAVVRLLGPSALVLAFVVFLVIGNPASGLASAPELLPTPWKEVGPLLPAGALGEALRGTAYFDGRGVLVPVLVLAAWTILGALANVALDRRRPAG